MQFIEIYNDKIRDLLHPGADSSAFRVREHPQTGPYVDNLVPVQVRACGKTHGKTYLLWSLAICERCQNCSPIWSVVGATGVFFAYKFVVSLSTDGPPTDAVSAGSTPLVMSPICALTPDGWDGLTCNL